MVVGPDWDSLTTNYRAGVLLGLLTAISYAGYMLFMRQARLHSSYAVPIREVAVMSLLVSVMLGAAALFEGESLVIATAQDAVLNVGGDNDQVIRIQCQQF